MLMHMTYKNVYVDEVSLTCKIFISCHDAKRVTVFVAFVIKSEQADPNSTTLKLDMPWTGTNAHTYNESK